MPPLLQPMICGQWDGCSIWLQWTPADSHGQTEYELRVTVRKTESNEWEPWMVVIPRQGSKSHWAVIPLWREGWFVKAEVRVASADNEPENPWEQALEVTFKQCTALFEFSTSKYEKHYRAGDTFHSAVDAAACSYELLEDIEVKVGAPVQIRMRAMGASGYFQLDYPGHLEIKPALGVVIKNIEASEEDVDLTGRDFSQLVPKPVADQVTIAVGTPNRF